MMRKYGGRVVFATRDEHGLIEVVEDAVERSLHFGTPAKQSGMSLHDPLRLQLSYTRAMLAPLLFQSADPARVLIVGLGGGSLAKFFLQQHPACRVDAVELRPTVAQVARSHFNLPDTPRLRVLLKDAAEFMLGADDGFSGYQLILVDAFTQEGVAQGACRMSFFESCRDRLTENGILGLNLWSRDVVDLHEVMATVKDALDFPILRLPVAGKDNVIAITGSSLLHQSRRSLSERAHALAARYEIEFPSFLKDLRKYNHLPF